MGTILRPGGLDGYDLSMSEDHYFPQSTSEVPRWRSTLSYLGGAFLGLVLLVAAWAKALDPASFEVQIQNEGLDFLLGAAAVAMIALMLEVGLGVALVLGVRHWLILGPSSLLVAFFLFLTGRTYWKYLQGIEPDDTGCGCFGNLVQRTPAEAFWQDALLMVPALLLAFLAVRGGRELPKVRLGVATLLALLAVVFAWKAPDLPLDNLATRLKPGTEPSEFCAGSEEDGSRVCVDGILPEIAEGEHLVILADLTDEAFTGQVPALNEHQLTGGDPPIWVLTGASEEELFQFRFGFGPAFEVREAPPALLRPLYRTLPRSFRVEGGQVVETWSGLPPVGK